LVISEETLKLVEEGKIPMPPKVIKEIYFKNEEIAFQIVET